MRMNENNTMNFSDTMTSQQQEEALLQQLCTIDQSLDYIVWIIIAILISYKTTKIQRQQIVCTIQGVDYNPSNTVCCLRLTSNLLTLIPVFFFYQLALTALNTPTTDCEVETSRQLNYQASTFILIGTLLRLCDILNSCK